MTVIEINGIMRQHESSQKHASACKIVCSVLCLQHCSSVFPCCSSWNNVCTS